MIFDAIIAAFIVAALSLTGVVVFGKHGHLIGTNRFIIPVAIGVFLGVVFFELIPETIALGGTNGSIAIVGGFLAFYLLSYLLRTYHHHHDISRESDQCEEKTGASLLLVGDGIHNITDGVVIASAFMINPAVGVATTIGVALHEIPQEIAEFGVLLKAGYSKTQAAFYNFLSASAIVLGVVLTFVFAEYFDGYIWVLAGIAAGNLLYIVASDFIPDTQRNYRQNDHFLPSFLVTIVALVAITLLLNWAHEEFGHGHAHHEAETVSTHDEHAGHDHEAHDHHDH